MQQETSVLVLQGGGALGAYQGGAVEKLISSGVGFDWVAGISIGAINAVLIAGNSPDTRIKRLREFWGRVSSSLQAPLLLPDHNGRTTFNELSSFAATLFGIPGFFAPRLMNPALALAGTEGAISYYDTTPLRDTLNALVDWDLLNNGSMRVSVGAVNVQTGNFRYFDTAHETITVDHIMASAALPPGFPPVKIGTEHYWDGGLVSNTPLQYVIETDGHATDMCIYQIDLFSAKGNLPRTIMEVAEREKEIRYSSRTRMVTDMEQTQQELRTAARKLLDFLPDDLKHSPEGKLLMASSCSNGISVLHLINRASEFDTQSKDYDFSRLSVTEHWSNGLKDTAHALASKAWRNRAIPAVGMVTFDNEKTKQHFEQHKDKDHAS